MCVCVCVCVREREREIREIKERGGERGCGAVWWVGVVGGPVHCAAVVEGEREKREERGYVAR